MKRKLTEFLKRIAMEGYATNKGNEWVKGKDGSTTILFGKLEDEWSAKDVFYGGEPYSGLETIFFKGKPYWAMVYYGKVFGEITNFEPIYSFLRKVLLECPEEMPVRGPKKLTDGSYRYANNWQGQINQFKGKEEIFMRSKKVYEAEYLGGLVDQRSED